MHRASFFTACAAALACVHCSGGAENVVADDSQDQLSAGAINGGSTGAMVRETTGAGFSCIIAKVTVPDYDPSQPGEPWVYFGIGDEGSIDLEAGLAFQQGDGSAAKPHRWLPYVRRRSTFWFGAESTRALPGDTFTLAAVLEPEGEVALKKDGERLTLVDSAGNAVDGVSAEGLSPSRAHVRRVVGNAVSTPYRGERLGTLGPVVFQDTNVCALDGSLRPFHGRGTWSTFVDGVRYGTVAWPAKATTHDYDAATDTDTITLFPSVE